MLKLLMNPSQRSSLWWIHKCLLLKRPLYLQENFALRENSHSRKLHTRWLLPSRVKNSWACTKHGTYSSILSHLYECYFWKTLKINVNSVTWRNEMSLCCEYNFHTLSEFLRHISLSHADKPNFYLQCNLQGCLQTNASFESYLNHIYIYHNTSVIIADHDCLVN